MDYDPFVEEQVVYEGVDAAVKRVTDVSGSEIMSKVCC
jgi:hypothetical protein